MRIGSIITLWVKAYGISSNNGFSVTKNKKTAQSINHNSQEDEIKITKKHAIVGGIVWAFYCLLWILPFINSQEFAQNFWPGIGLSFFVILTNIIPSLAIVGFLFYSSFFGKNMPEYHACEHKVIALLGEKKLRPTLENLKKMPRITPWCGTFIYGLFVIIPLILLLVMGSATLKLFSETNLVVRLIIAFSLICLIFILPLLLQFFLATREPAEEKLKEALEVAKEFYK